AMFIIIAVSFTALQFGLGIERIFQPGVYDVTLAFMIPAIAISIIAAIIGGFVSASIARSAKAPVALAILVLILGIITAAMQLTAPAAGARPADLTPFEAAQNARHPAWYAIALPIIGAAGVMVGARLRRSPKSRPA